MGMGGTTITGTSTGLVWQHTNIWAGGKLLGTYDGGSAGTSANTYGLHFYFDDPLGTRRAQTDSAGVIEQTCSSLPYGDQLSCDSQPDAGGNISPYIASIIAPTEHHFTGKERDVESGNDYFEARYYNSAMGRFMSPDPLPWIHAQHGNEDNQKDFDVFIANPQNFNQYAYVNNNPLNKTDPTGMNACGQDFDAGCNVTIKIQDRKMNDFGNYTDEFTNVKNQRKYNAIATVSVNGEEVGTYLMKTTPSYPEMSGTTANGVYSATWTWHNGNPAIRLQPTLNIPTALPNPAQGNLWIAQGILVHPAGSDNSVAGSKSRPVSAGCLVVCTNQYPSFERATGLKSKTLNTFPQ
jgi:RHS repeat-associated protein